MQIDAVVFDIGRVLLEWEPEQFFDEKIGAARRRELFSAVDLYGMHDGVDAGAPLKQTVYDFADQHPDHAAEIRLWHDNWNDMVGPAIDHSVRLLRALRAKGIRVFSLTNFGTDTLEWATRKYPFLEEFEARFVSAELGFIKPDPAIYAALEDATGIDPGRLLFADDRHDNIETAAARGWNVHLFENPQGWADRLVCHGLLTREEAV